MIHTQETKQQVDSNTCCKHVSVSGKNAQHSNWIFKARRQKCNILDRSKEVECWESNGNILICTPQLEKLFQSTFFFAFKPPFQLTHVYFYHSYDFLLFPPHNLVSDICQTFCRRHLYLCSCVCLCTRMTTFCVCVCRLWENQTWRRDSWHPFRHCLTFLSSTITLIYTHPHRTSGVKCLNLKFGTNIFSCFIYTWNDENQKNCLLSLSVVDKLRCWCVVYWLVW